MAHCILGQSLQRKRWNGKIEGLGINFQSDSQAVFIAELFERKVLTCEVVFFGELDQWPAILLQRVAKHVPQALDSGFCHRRTKLHQGRHCVKGVKQEVWIQPGADGIQTRG